MTDFPRSLLEFQRRFPDAAACAAYLDGVRWPEGFVCPACGSVEAWHQRYRGWLYQCKGCRTQTSVTAGTVMHGSKLPLTVWFWAAYLMATHSNGISARQLQRQLGLGSYKSAWLLCTKLRRAMVAPDRSLLSGLVEVDETHISYRVKTMPRPPASTPSSRPASPSAARPKPMAGAVTPVPPASPMSPTLSAPWLRISSSPGSIGSSPISRPGRSVSITDCASPICKPTSTNSPSASTAAGRPMRPFVPCSVSALPSNPPNTRC